MDFQEVGWRGTDWIDLARDRDRWRALVNAVMNLMGTIKCREFLNWLMSQVPPQEGTLFHGISALLFRRFVLVITKYQVISSFTSLIFTSENAQKSKP